MAKGYNDFSGKDFRKRNLKSQKRDIMLKQQVLSSNMNLFQRIDRAVKIFFGLFRRL